MASLVFNAYTNLGDFLSLPSYFIKQQWLFHGRGGNKAARPAHSHDHAEVEEYQNCLEHLPKEIVETLIYPTLSLADQIRMSSVSKSCCDRIKGVSPAPQLPWLLLPRDDLDDKKLKFFDMSEGKVHNFKLPSQLQGASLCGSSKGWLVFSKPNTHLSYYVTMVFWLIGKGFTIELEIFLFNPISNSVIQLPSVKAPSNRNLNIIPRIIFVKLSSANLEKCIISLLIDTGGYDESKLAFCRPRVDNEWWILNGLENRAYLETSFFNGILCVLGIGTSEDEDVEKFKFNLGDGCEVDINTIPYFSENPPYALLVFGDDHGDDIGIDGPDIENENEIGSDDEDDDNENDMGVRKIPLKDPYLIESTNGELLLIVKITDSFTNSMQLEEIENYDEFFHHSYRKTSNFEVYKMDLSVGEFKRVDDIGDQVIFLTPLGSQSCLATDFEGIRGNCIYFVEDANRVGYEESTSIPSRESGVYYIDEHKIEHLFPNMESNTDDRPTWFMPYL